MVYSDFTVRKVKQAFGITTIEGPSFFPELEPIVPSQTLIESKISLDVKRVKAMLQTTLLRNSNQITVSPSEEYDRFVTPLNS